MVHFAFDLKTDREKLFAVAGGTVAALGLIHIAAYFYRVSKFPKFNNSEPKLLPQQVTDPKAAKARADGIVARRKEYRWHYDIPGVPPFLREIPKHEYSGETQDHHINFSKRVIKAQAALKLNRAVDKVADKLKRKEVFDRYANVFSGATLKPPLSVGPWRTDEFFAAQRLIGINPLLIKRLDKVPENFPLDPKVAEKVTGTPLSSLLKAGRVFICDYELVQRVRDTFPVERRMYAPIVLYYSDVKTNKLLPLAIQLSQTPGPDFPIFTPLDPPGLWLLVKMHCQVADANLHEVAYHLMPTHIMMEAVYVAMVRNVSTQHPIHTWLRQHFFYTININWAARTLLIGPEGAVPKLMMGYEGTVALLQESAKHFDFRQLHIPNQIKSRGVDSKEVLPTYYYRDDALAYWDMTLEFVTKMVKSIYTNDATLAADTEVANWFHELTYARGPSGCGFTGIPLDANGKMTKLDDFIMFITMVITNVSVGHGAVNNGQFDFMAFIPNCPFTLKMGAPPTKEWDIEESEIAKMMLTDQEVREAVVFVNMLCMPPEVDDDPDIFGSYNGEYFQQEPIKAHVDGLKKRLEKLAGDIDRRQHYRFLHPKRVTQGVDE